MRLLVELTAEADAEYNESYHHKLRGRFWRSLEETKYEEAHDRDEMMGMCFSNIFPYPHSDGKIREGVRMYVQIASPHQDLLAAVAKDLNENAEFYVGQMMFSVKDIDSRMPDVGSRGTSGTLRTATGVICRIPASKRDEYGIDAPEDSPFDTFWRREHSVEPFMDKMVQNLDHKHRLFDDPKRTKPSDIEYPLFDSYDLQKTYALPVMVTTGKEQTFVVSKWDFGYTVQDDNHRRHLNLLLDTGIGEKNAYGFGYLNIV